MNIKTMPFEQATELQQRLINYFARTFFDVLNNGVYFWIAGGSIGNKIIGHKSDFDLFFLNENDLNSIKSCLMADGGVIKFDTDTAVHIEWKGKNIDLVKLYYNSPQECIKTFDFTVAMVAIDTQKTIFYHESFYEHMAHRALIINALPYPISTMRRSYKYQKKGFHICSGGIAKIAEAIKNMNGESQNTAMYID